MTLLRTLLALAVLPVAACAPTSDGVTVTRDVPYSDAAVLDVYTTAGAQAAPVFVLLHGCCGDRRDLAQLARGLAEGGAVVFNASWHGLHEGARYPGAYQLAACAARFARWRAADFGGDPGRVALVGWSDGAMLAAVVAASGDYFREGCGVASAAADPAALVGIGAFLGWPAGADGVIDRRYVNDRTVAFFGGSPEEVPSAWASGNPYTHLHRRPDVNIALVVGAEDTLLADNLRFAAAARSTGHRVDVTVVPGAGHLDVLAASTAQGAATVRALLEIARTQKTVRTR